jgi:hypothetical protein
MGMAMKVEARRNSVCGQCATAGEEDVSGTAIGTELSAWIIDLFSGEGADFGYAAAPAAAAQPDPLEGQWGGAGWLPPPRRW